MKKKYILSICLMLAVVLGITGCGKKANLDDNKTAVSLKDSKITATEYYNEIKKSNISKLVDMIDHELFDEKYKSDEEEDKSVKEQINQIKSSYEDEATFLNVIKQYFGVNSEKELEDMLRLEYKRNEAVEDYVKKDLSDKEIENYYNDNIYGDIKASHILVKPEVKSDATDAEKEKAEKKAKEETKKIINKLNKGEDFAKLAKEYSDDTATASKGGDLGYFNSDDMDENFWDAAKKLEKNTYSKEPVKSQYGYHIILKVDQKEKPKLKEVKEDIKSTLANAKLKNNSTLHYESLMKIREENKIKWNDDELEKQYNELMNQLLDAAKSNQNTTN